MPNISGGVDINKIYQVLEKAGDELIDASGNDSIINKTSDIEGKLATLEGEERALVDMLFRFTDHRDPKPGARVTHNKVRATIEYAKEKLVKRLDADNDHQLTNAEIGRMSRIGQLAAAIAKKADAAPPAPAPAPGGINSGYGDLIDTAVGKDLATVKENESGQLKYFRVSSDWDSGRPTDLVNAIMDLPIVEAGALESFALGYINSWEHEDSYSAALDAVAAKGPFEKLKEAVIGDFTQNETEISWVEIGDVSKLFEIAPNLEKLKVKGGGISLGELDSESLRSLTLHSGGLPAGAIQSVNDAKLPNLERLEVWFGSSEYGAEGNVGMLDKLMQGTELPKLRRLGLMNAEFSNEIVAALANSQILPQLTSIDLSMGTLDATGAQTLIDNKDKFAHLSINVSDNYIDEDTRAALKEAFGWKIQLGEQSKAEWGDDPQDRYVSVGE